MQVNHVDSQQQQQRRGQDPPGEVSSLQRQLQESKLTSNTSRTKLLQQGEEHSLHVVENGTNNDPSIGTDSMKSSPETLDVMESQQQIPIQASTTTSEGEVAENGVESITSIGLEQHDDDSKSRSTFGPPIGKDSITRSSQTLETTESQQQIPNQDTIFNSNNEDEVADIGYESTTTNGSEQQSVRSKLRSSSSPAIFSALQQQQRDKNGDSTRRSFRTSLSTGSVFTSSAPVVSTTKPTLPGGYRITKSRSPETTTYKVLVPKHVQPGTEFTVEIPEPEVPNNNTTTSPDNVDGAATAVKNRRVQVMCPTEDTIPGETEIEILVPAPASYQYHTLKTAQLTIAPTTSVAVAGKAFPMLPSIKKINQQAVSLGATIRTRVITIPETAIPGHPFSYYMNGYNRQQNGIVDKVKRGKLKIECPVDCKPGDRLRIILPAELPEPEPLYQTFNVVVPEGAVGGGHFAVEIGLQLANQQQVLVECPHGALPGEVLAIQLPTKTVVAKFQALTYPSTGTGWKRTVRISDLHFQWVRLEESIVRAPKSTNTNPMLELNGSADDNYMLDWASFHEKAYVRKMVHLEGNDPRLRTASLTLVSAETASAPSKLKTADGSLLFSYADIAHQQSLSLQAKHKWFLEVCKLLNEYSGTTNTDATNAALVHPPDYTIHQSVRIIVRREKLLVDSLRAILSLSAEDMRRNWEIEFVNEIGIDQGGLTKEWLQCVTELVFLPSTGLFLPSLNNQAAVDINPVSAIACPHQNHLLYYRFVGRVLGRALFTGHLVKGHFVRLLYKHLLGWPITIEDIRDQDDGYYAALQELMGMNDESLAAVCLDFTVNEGDGNIRVVHELIENGANVAVCRRNLATYIEATIRYRLFDRILPQLTELLLGFYDVVPEQALAVFDANELELVLCGLPEIDVDDWQTNTVYIGLFKTGNELVVQWFWEIVRDVYDLEMKARLLQFVTGTSGVPSNGFASLRGGDDTPRLFTIQGVNPRSCLYPKAHTCFNVLDLPNYESKEDLQQRLTFSITTSFVGFDSE